MSQFIEMFGNPVTNTKSWSTAKIKDVAPEVPSKQQLSGKVWLLNLDMIESNTGHVIEKVYEDVENALSVQAFDEGNVLFSKLRPYLNKVIIPDDSGLATTELVPLRPEQSKLHKVFLSHLLRGDQFVNYANDIAGGTKMPRMPLSELRNFKCILPPIDKQLQFVAIAEQADKSKFADFKSQFIEMFGTLDEPKVNVSKLIDVVVSSGQYGSNTSATDYQEGKPRYIRITDINDDGSLNDDIKTAEVIDDKYRLESGDIVFARTGATVGKTYLHEAGDAIYAGYLIKYQMDSELMKPLFMKAFTHSKTYYNWVANSQKVGAQPNISATQYDQMPILVPSVDEQEAFLKIYQQADKSKSHVHIAMIEIELHCNII